MAKATGPKYSVKLRRRRDFLTNYQKRLALVKSGKPRLVVRKSQKHILVQFIEYADSGDRTLACAHSKELEKMGWPARGNAPTAYLTGLLGGRRALVAGVKEVVFDIGLHAPTKGAIVFASLKGVLDAGVKANAGEELFNAERIKGAHIAAYAGELKAKDAQAYEKRFSAYIKAGVAPESLGELFEKTKEAIMKADVSKAKGDDS
ncbi:MAG: 50S ribosomal protein L18 [Candidatus Micrarchaeota archaeon]